MADGTQKGNSSWWAIVLVLLLPVLYVLSAGPAVALMDRTGKGEEAVMIVYAPLEWLAANTPLKKPLVWYVGLWEKQNHAGEPMSAKWVLFKTVQREPANKLACDALADLLEEEDCLDLSFTYRWMGWYDRRPGKREGSRLRKRFVWYKQGAFEDWYWNDEADRYNDLVNARLDPLVYQSLPNVNPQYQLYSTWEKAGNDLSEGLARLRALLEKPPEPQASRKER